MSKLMILLFFPLVVFSQKNHNNYSVYTSDENLRITFEDQEYEPSEFWMDKDANFGNDYLEIWCDEYYFNIKKISSLQTWNDSDGRDPKPLIDSLAQNLKKRGTLNNIDKNKKFSKVFKYYSENKTSDSSSVIVKELVVEKIIFSVWGTDNNLIDIGIIMLIEKDLVWGNYLVSTYQVILESKADTLKSIENINISKPSLEEKNTKEFNYTMSQHPRWYSMGNGNNEYNRAIINYLNSSIELDSLNAKYYYKIGYAYWRIGNQLKNINNTRKAVLLNPSNSYYRRGLAFSHYNGDSSFDSIITNINKALEIEYKAESMDRENILRYTLDKSQLLNKVGNFSESLKNLSNINIDSLESSYDRGRYSGLFNKANQGVNNLLNTQKDRFYLRSEKFYPYVSLTNKDTLNYPIRVGLKFNLLNIFNFKDDSDQDFVQLEYETTAISKYPPIYHKKGLKVLSTDSTSITKLNDKLFIKSIDGMNYPNEAIYNKYKDLYEYKFNSEILSFNNSFKLRDFPFDTQKINLRVEIDSDSTVYRFDEESFYSSIGNITGLKEGYSVEKISTNFGYYKTENIKDFQPGLKRNIVNSYVDITLEIKRSGSLLFLKLFLGTFLAVIMSLSSFFIDKRNFGSRIDVAVGALFICVGNKYFVESVTPVVQILTKADIINNISLILIIFNVLIVIGQRRQSINLKKFEDSKFALKFSAICFFIILLTTIFI